MPYIVYTPESMCVEIECTSAPVGNGLCRKHYNRAWQVKNRNRRNDQVKNRRATDPEFLNYRRDLIARKERERRAAKAQTEVTKISKEEYDHILAEFNNCCWICEVALVKVFWDHVQPLAKGGAHTVDNLRPACNPCNTRKNATWPFTDDMKKEIAAEVCLINSRGGDA